MSSLAEPRGNRQTPASRHPPRVLVVAGDPSGDQAAANVLRELGPRACTFGYAGPLCTQLGLADAARGPREPRMGLLQVAPNVLALARVRSALLDACRSEPPVAALLVNFSEFNARLLAPLRALGIPSVFYGPPQVWAWRSGRARAIARDATCIATMFPFEVEVWRAAGANVVHVGHPAFAGATPPAPMAGSASTKPLRVALLMGSRRQEIDAHCELFLRAARIACGLHQNLECIVVAAAALPDDARRTLLAAASRAGLQVEVAANGQSLVARLAGFSAALCVSGTASLECAAAGVPPVIAYATSKAAAQIAPHVLRTRFIGLPNVLLGYAAFPEHLGHNLSAELLARELLVVLARPEPAQRNMRRLARLMQVKEPPAVHLARLLCTWMR